jgi:hypothetical protein
VRSVATGSKRESVYVAYPQAGYQLEGLRSA